MPATPSHLPRVAVLADSDTRWKWGALTARHLLPDVGEAPRGYLLRGRATPTQRQLRDTGVEPSDLHEVTLTGLLAAFAGAPDAPDAPDAAPDVLVIACVGHTVQAVLQGLVHIWPEAARRPVTVTGYPGVVYEKLTEGLLLRHGADLLLAGGPGDAARFADVLRGVGADDGGVAVSPLPFLGGARHDPQLAAHGERRYRVVFATQPSVPDGRRERGYLLERVVGHARRHPEREVVLKLRSAPGEHTTHVEDVPYQRLAARLPSPPANFRLAYGPMGPLLDTTDLLVTVSSTAALEALSRGVPTAVLTDLGIREPLGNHYFTGSGCYASWDQLDAGHLPEPDTDWLRRQGVPAGPGDDPGSVARERLAALIARAEAGGLPPLAPYYRAERAPAYLPRLLARHGLGPDGAPAPGAASARAPGLPSRLAHRAARRMYRAGVQRVAPHLRRWGRL